MPAHTITFHGNAQLDTAQKKFGASSLLLDGTGDYLSIPDSPDWNFSQETQLSSIGGGLFSTVDIVNVIVGIDFWFRFNTLPTAGNGMAFFSRSKDRSGTEDGLMLGYFYVTPSGEHNLGYTQRETNFGGVRAVIAPTGTLSTGTWYHANFMIQTAAVAGNNFGIDGSLKSAVYLNNTVVDGNVFNFDSSGKFYIGAWVNLGVVSDFFDGWIDEFRVTIQGQRKSDWNAPQHYSPLKFTSGSTYTVPTSAHTNNRFTRLLLHFDGADGATSTTDSSAAVARPRMVRNF